MFFAEAKRGLRRFQDEVSSTSRVLLDSRNWFFSLPDDPGESCDVMVTFWKNTEIAVIDWLERLLNERVPELAIKRAFHRLSREHVFYVTASYNNLLLGTEALGLKRRLRTDFGGGYREFQVDEADLYEDVRDPARFLSSQERQEIVHHFLLRLKAEPHDRIPIARGRPDFMKIRKITEFYAGQSIIPHLQSRRFVKQVFPLHDNASLRELSHTWVQAFFSAQPLDRIRQYFGVKIAMYFAWLGHYTAALIFPTVFGLVAWKVAGKDNRDLYYVASALFNILWATLYLEHWKRSCCRLAYQWGTLDCASELLKEPRPLFEGTPSRCQITGNLVPQYPSWKRQLVRYGVSAPIVILCLIAVFCAMLAIFRLQEMTTALIASGAIPTWSQHAPKVLLALVVGLMGEIYKRIAVWLNDLENYRLEETYITNLILKLVLFQCVNNYLSLFYIAFWLRNLRLLKQQLAALLITKQLVGNIKEVLAPVIISKLRQYRIGVSYERQKKNEAQSGASCDAACGSGAPEAGMTQSEREATKQTYADPYEDYLEMFIQFGYVSMFACAFPLAGLFCLANNVVEIRSDAFKLVTSFQRPFGERASDIGIWQQAMEVMSGVAIVVNVALLGVSGGIQRILPGLSPWQMVLLLAGLEHLVIILKAGIAIAIPDVPEWIEEEMAKMEYRRREALKKAEREDMKETFRNSSSDAKEIPEVVS